MVGGVGLKHLELLPDIVPVLITALQDITPAVARQSGICGTDLFRSTLVRIAIQVIKQLRLESSELKIWLYTCMPKDGNVFCFGILVIEVLE